MWIGAHDIYENDYLSLLIEKLNEGNFSYDLIFSNISNIDDEGMIIQKKKEIGFEFNNLNLITRMIKLPWVLQGSGDMVMGLFSRKALERTNIFSENVLWPDNLLIHQIASMGNIARVEQVLRARRYFREEKFDNWNEKYIHLVNRYQSSRGERKIGVMLRLPIFAMFLLIIYRIGIVSMLRNPLMLFLSLYIATIYLWKHKVALWIDLKTLFSSTQS